MTAVPNWFNSSTDACSNGASTATQTYYSEGTTACLATSTSNVVWMDNAKKTTLNAYVQYQIYQKWFYQPNPCGTGNGVAVQFNSLSYPTTINNC